MSSGLGSLSQGARSNQLNSARGILLVVGLLTTVVNAYHFTQVEKEIEKLIQADIGAAQAQAQALGQYFIVDQDQLVSIRRHAIRIAKAINGGAIALGVVFIVMGATVTLFPVPITIAGLVLYVGGMAVFGFIDPTTILAGVFIKLFIIAGLAKSIQTALAYQREQKAASLQPANLEQQPSAVGLDQPFSFEQNDSAPGEETTERSSFFDG